MSSRNHNEQTLKEALREFFTLFQLNTKMNNARVQTCWEEVMGKTIAHQTGNLQVKNGVLYLSITSAPLKQELYFNREKIVQRLNERIGEEHIKEVVFR
ncbi:DUF721 domain-containing protein [Sphingobacteriales bacterium UPWRP_1]|nr:hypothetical protein B6N25_10265 [Sphingobacteriales bacterium TSM_CSS]PSJ73833.1 DUF721 domain-containing protein [Sphingobacteriales bacterium UPWRP_1]